MKKIFFILSFLSFVWQANAKVIEGIVADDVSIMKGNQALVSINYQFAENNDEVYVGYEFKLDMPAGITLLKNESGLPIYNLDSENSAFNITRTEDGFGAMPQELSTKLKGKSGSLMTLTFIADNNLAVGSTHNVKIWDVKLSKRGDNNELISEKFDEFTFTVTIVENLVVLDETSTDAPGFFNGVNVQVNRKINANEWSTICLPFDMDADQVKAAFGDDVILGDFKGHEAVVEGRTTTTIRVLFEGVNEIVKNRPYIIKLFKDGGISSFTVDNVNIAPEEKPTNSAGIGRIWSDMIGTYIAGTTVPKDCLFLNGNQFWYANDEGKTKMKAFRAYFDLFDILTYKELTNSNIALAFEEADGINNVTMGQPTEGIYDIQGRKVHTDENKWDNLKKGVYIINGKKIVK